MATTIGSLDLNAFSDLYSDSNQYFWFESNASATYGAGAHVTLVPDASFISNPTGQNILMNTDGFSIRNGLLPMMTLDNDSLDFNVVDTTAGTYTTTATFTSTGAQIGQSGGAHSVINANGQRFYASNGTTQLANIGYGEGQSQSGTDIAPYYTFGVRQITNTAYSSSSTYDVGDMCVYDEKVYVCVQDITTPESWNANHWQYYIGNYSMAGGYSTTASGWHSYAEGFETIAIGSDSHAEGRKTTARGATSHAEGYGTTAGSMSHAEGYETTASGSTSHAEGHGTIASGWYSHAEGYETTASGAFSHVGGLGTTAQRKSQTVIGEYNIVDEGGTDETTQGYYAFIIGNGYVDTQSLTVHKSNALTVDWAGNVEAAGTISGASQQLTPTISVTKGTTVRYSIRRFGNVVTLYFTVRNTASTAAGEYIYQANISGIPFPADWATSAVYYGARPLVVSFSYTGLLSLRNTCSAAFAMGANDSVSFSITYVID